MFILFLILFAGFNIVVFLLIGFFISSVPIAFCIAALTAILVGLGIKKICPLNFKGLLVKSESKSRLNHSAVIQELSQVLSENLSVEEIRKNVSRVLRNIFNLNKAYVLLISEISSSDPKKADNFVLSKTVINFLTNHKHAVVISEIPYFLDLCNEDDIFLNKALVELRFFGKKRQLGAVVPIIVDKKLIAIMILGKNSKRYKFSEDDLRLINTISYQIGTTIKKAELYQKLESYTKDLAEKVKHRTAKIKKMHEEQKQIMLDISHNLQTPLTVVKGELNFLQNKMPQNRALFTFEKSIDKISKFIFDLLNIAKLESNIDDLKMSKVNLSDVARDLVEYLDTLFLEKKINLITNIDPNIFVYGNKDKLEELITNIVSNSVKYIDNQRKIYMSLHSNQDSVFLIIKDTGRGMSGGDMEKVFERFYRSKSVQTKKDENTGSGLGLAIAKRIVEIHKGTINIESKLGEGTDVTIEFPVFKNAA